MRTCLANIIMKDINNKKINVGLHCIWYDPEKEHQDISRVWEIYKVDGDVVYIADEYGEAEVFPSEIEIVY